MAIEYFKSLFYRIGFLQTEQNAFWKFSMLLQYYLVVICNNTLRSEIVLESKYVGQEKLTISSVSVPSMGRRTKFDPGDLLKNKEKHNYYIFSA